MEEKKQNSWFNTEVEFEKSFKWWFALQWQNFFIQLFTVAFVLLVLEFINFGWVIETVLENFINGGVFGGIATILGLSIPALLVPIIAYKGFWQFWNDMKNGTTR